MINIVYDIRYVAIILYVLLRKFSKRIFSGWFDLQLKTFIVKKKSVLKKHLSKQLQSDYQELSKLLTD